MTGLLAYWTACWHVQIFLMMHLELNIIRAIALLFIPDILLLVLFPSYLKSHLI
jgi:hypothetical protein